MMSTNIQARVDNTLASIQQELLQLDLNPMRLLYLKLVLRLRAIKQNSRLIVLCHNGCYIFYTCGTVRYIDNSWYSTVDVNLL